MQAISLITSLKVNKDAVNTFGIISSNNIISISSDGSITIFDGFLKIKQKIENAHQGTIFDISIKDENNFATCSADKSIKTWNKTDANNFKLNNDIKDIHEDDIHKIIYLEDNSIISGSKDSKIKILKLINKEYKCHVVLDHIAPVYSMLYIKENKLLISSGILHSSWWDLNDGLNSLITKIDAFCYGKNALQRIDKERIIIGGREKLQIVSIKGKKIIKEIENDFLVWAICIVEKKKLIICGGVSNNIAIFNSDNYDKILVTNCHSKNIRGISLISNEKIITGSEDKKTKIWRFINNKK